MSHRAVVLWQNHQGSGSRSHIQSSRWTNMFHELITCRPAHRRSDSTNSFLLARVVVHRYVPCPPRSFASAAHPGDSSRPAPRMLSMGGVGSPRWPSAAHRGGRNLVQPTFRKVDGSRGLWPRAACRLALAATDDPARRPPDDEGVTEDACAASLAPGEPTEMASCAQRGS